MSRSRPRGGRALGEGANSGCDRLALIAGQLTGYTTKACAQGVTDVDHQIAARLIAALAALAGRHYRTWRLAADGEGLHLRRLLLPSLDLPWGEVDCVALTDRGQGVCLVAGGGRRASFPAMYIASGDDPALLRGACREHGVPMCLEEELPDGVVGPHGLERHGMEDWRVVALFSAGFVVVLVGLFVLLQVFFGG